MADHYARNLSSVHVYFYHAFYYLWLYTRLSPVGVHRVRFELIPVALIEEVPSTKTGMASLKVTRVAQQGLS